MTERCEKVKIICAKVKEIMMEYGKGEVQTDRKKTDGVALFLKQMRGK